MADIFISYSKQDPEPTRALAADLEALGYTTWWDTSLMPGDRFPERIRQELEAAKVVVVIWSDASAKSEWVYAEAQIAQGMGKLITVHVPGFDVKRVPIPFNGRHIEPVTKRSKIYAALEMFSVKALAPPVTADADNETRSRIKGDITGGGGMLEIVERILAALIVLVLVSLLIVLANNGSTDLLRHLF